MRVLLSLWNVYIDVCLLKLSSAINGKTLMAVTRLIEFKRPIERPPTAKSKQKKAILSKALILMSFRFNANNIFCIQVNICTDIASHFQQNRPIARQTSIIIIIVIIFGYFFFYLYRIHQYRRFSPFKLPFRWLTLTIFFPINIIILAILVFRHRIKKHSWYLFSNPILHTNNMFNDCTCKMKC